MCMKFDFDDFRISEVQRQLTSPGVVGVRIPVIMQRRLKSKAMELGTTESMLMRFLATKALESYGIKALEVF